jgi:hypothetical protein
MRDFVLGIISFLISFTAVAQVGIGTVNPDPSSALDIMASDKGILVPRVSLSNVSTTTLDGTNTAADGLLIYNSNASVTGGNGVGYYIFNGSRWKKLQEDERVAVRLFTGSNITAFSNASETSLILNGTSFNYGGGIYNPGTGSYTIPYDGVYSIRPNLNMNFVTSSNKEMVIVMRIYVNGFLRDQQNLQDGATYASGYTQNFMYDFLLNLNANDVVTFRFLPVWGASSPAPYISNSYTNIQIVKEY